jgi:hypothetical protein
MTNSTSNKHMVWVEKPIGTRIGIGYSTLKEAKHQSLALERDGYKVIEITATSLPKPNVG